MNPIIAPEAAEIRPSTGLFPTTSVRAYSIAVLQQYTNSFSQENLVGSGTLGNVYRAELPDGRVGFLITYLVWTNRLISLTAFSL